MIIPFESRVIKKAEVLSPGCEAVANAVPKFASRTWAISIDVHAGTGFTNAKYTKIVAIPATYSTMTLGPSLMYSDPNISTGSDIGVNLVFISLMAPMIVPSPIDNCVLLMTDDNE